MCIHQSNDYLRQVKAKEVGKVKELPSQYVGADGSMSARYECGCIVRYAGEIVGAYKDTTDFELIMRVKVRDIVLATR